MKPVAADSLRRARGCFVTGTDTGVGKTLVSAALAAALREQGLDVGVMKLVETGWPESATIPSDAHRLRTAAGVSETVEQICPYRFPAPLAPLAAARAAGCQIEMPVLMEAFRRLADRHAYMIVEGVGGLLVPVTETLDVSDVLVQLGLPAIVVGRAALGGVNHACLTLDALKARNVPILALVLNRAAGEGSSMQTDSTYALLAERCRVPVLGPLPYEPLLAGDWPKGVAAISRQPAIRSLVSLVNEARFSETRR